MPSTQRWMSPNVARPHHQLIELRADLAYQRGQWTDALRLYADARLQHGQTTATRARKRAALLYLRGRLDEADEVCAAVGPRRTRSSVRGPVALPALGDLLGAR